ncbi:class I SAM-dependent RNA methyltransferase [Shimia aestuarii]|uniref:class I SAM-dependent RNA methyltransferase n=1 Tax=Shimia aestuarii TaxID=254406 RepID=UPI001FB36AC7|nr:class I SAM-dependent RNA methyltransferase [Shimia aestuarii]
MPEFLIERVGHQGDGIAAGPVFAFQTLPGEKVSGDLQGNRLEGVKIVEPSAERVRPPCRHFKSCGGCQMQHASDDFVASWKPEIVETALRAHGLETNILPIKTSPAHSRRRVVLSARRTKKGATSGFHQRSSDVIVEVPDCQLIPEKLLPAVEAAKRLTMVGASRKAELSVTATLSAAGIDIAVTGGKPLDGPLHTLLAQEAERSDLARLSWGDDVVVTRHPPVQKFGNADVVPPFGAFLQATLEGEAALVEAVRDAIGNEGKRGIDLFAGCGTFTLPLASSFEMHAVEGEAQMLHSLDQGWRQALEMKRVTTEARDLFRNPILAEDLRYDFAVIDPPRAGAEAQVRELAKTDLRTIAFVSCNPVTFARDAEILSKAGYALEWIQVVDQFRWSTHVELAAKFVRG